MSWSSLITTLIAAGAGILGVGYGSRLSRGDETLSWTRDQRLKAYVELLGAIEKCYEAFTLIAACLDLAQYEESARVDPKVRGTLAEWGKWMEEVDRCLPQAELVCSQHLQPYVIYLRLGLRSRQRMLLMKLDYGQGVNQEEWKFVSSKTHGEILEIRQKLRDDITYLDLPPKSLSPSMRRFKILRRRTRERLRIGSSGRSRKGRPGSRVSNPEPGTGGDATVGQESATS